MSMDRAQPEPWWRRWDMPSSQARIESIDGWYLWLADLITRDRQPRPEQLFEFEWVIAEAATANDLQALAAVVDALRSLIGLVPGETRWTRTREHLNAMQNLAFLAHFSLVDEPA